MQVPYQWRSVLSCQRVLVVEKQDMRSRSVGCAMSNVAIVARLDISRKCADNVRNQVFQTAVARVAVKAARTAATPTSAIVVDNLAIGDLIALIDTRIAVVVANVDTWHRVCQSESGVKANAQAVDLDEPDEECKEIQHVWALSVSNKSETLPVDSGNLLNMIMDSGAEEHVVSLDDWRRLGKPLLKPAQVRLRSATGDDMGVSGSFVVQGWCDDKLVELTALVADRATNW